MEDIWSWSRCNKHHLMGSTSQAEKAPPQHFRLLFTACRSVMCKQSHVTIIRRCPVCLQTPGFRGELENPDIHPCEREPSRLQPRVSSWPSWAGPAKVSLPGRWDSRGVVPETRLRVCLGRSRLRAGNSFAWCQSKCAATDRGDKHLGDDRRRSDI